jgi:hypothetical protein
MSQAPNIDGVLLQCGDRLFYPGNRIMRVRPQPKLSGLAAQQRAAIIRQRIEATVVRRAPQVMVKVTGGGRGMMAIAAPRSQHQQERPTRHRGSARRDPSSADAKSSQLAQPGRAGFKC